MQLNNIKFKIVMTIFTIGVSLWLGGVAIRLAIAYDLFVPATELTLKSNYSDDIRLHTVQLYAMTGLYTGVGFGCAFIAMIIFFILYRKEFRKRGWLFMSFAFFILASPYEIYMIYLDLMLNFSIWYGWIGKYSDSLVHKYFTIRFTKLAIPSALSFFSVLSSIIVLIWRPLDKSN